MAGSDRAEITTVRDRLLEEGHAFSFYQAVSLLERALNDSPAVGTLGPVENERIRFSGTKSLGFAASDISEIETVDISGRPPLGSADDPTYVEPFEEILPESALDDGDLSETAVDDLAQTMYRLHVTFMGLYGPPSPLPPAVTESIIRLDKPNDELADFLDVFNHRFVSLAFRVWKKYRYYIEFKTSGDDPFSQIVFAVLGLDHETAATQFGRRWVRLMSFAGLLGMYCHSAPMLAALISHYFDGLQVEIEEFCGRIVTIAPEQRSRLGNPTAQLGETLTLGDHVHDVAGKFRIWMGPMDFETYSRFLPDGEWFHELRNLVRTSLRDQLDFDLGVVINPDNVPRCTMGKGSKSPLGWAAWLGGECKERVKVVRDMHLHEAAQ